MPEFPTAKGDSSVEGLEAELKTELSDDPGNDPEDDASTEVAAPAARRIRDSVGFAGLGETFSTDEPTELNVSPSTAPSPISASASAPPSSSSSSSSSPRSNAPSVQPTSHSTASTPLEAMHVDEWERTKIFCRQALVIDAAALISAPLIGGDETAKLLMYIGLLIAAAAFVWLLVTMRTAVDYTYSRIFPAALVVGTSVQSGIYFFGVFSPAPAVVLLGIYFFSKGSFAKATSAIYLLCAASQAVIAGLVIGGLIDDLGLVSGQGLELVDKIVVQVIIQLLYLVSFLVARASRDSQLMALTSLEEALRQVGVRDALLEEARGDLNRALRIGDRGRHSGQMVGSFQLGVLIGRGGMGEVYDATHSSNGTNAAVKLLHPAALASDDQLGRFLREIEAISLIEVPEVVRLYEYGNLPDGAPFLIMEKLDGVDLSAHLRDRRRLSPPQIAELIRQIGRGLNAAWELGIVHRDIKPQNLFRLKSRGPSGVRWKVLDFGVSKLANSGGTLTRGHVVGTPGYMAPEQARGEEVDARADLYALAVIAYRSLTGRPAYSAKDVPTTMYEVVYGTPHRPSDVAPNLHPDVDLALAIGLAKSPADRFGDPTELANAIEVAAKGELPERYRSRARALLADKPWKEG